MYFFTLFPAKPASVPIPPVKSAPPAAFPTESLYDYYAYIGR